MSWITQIVLLLAIIVASVLCASKDKAHGHQGALDRYSGMLIPLKITPEQHKKLAKNEPVRKIQKTIKSNKLLQNYYNFSLS